MQQARAEHRAGRVGMEGLEAAGGDLEGVAARQTD